MPLDPKLIKQLLETFQGELEEQLQIMTAGLLLLEKGNLADDVYQENIEAIFRAAHNLKGAARSLDINHVGDLAHHLESLFSLIRNKSLEINYDLINICFESIDKMQIAMQDYLQQKPLSFDIVDLNNRLESIGKKESKTIIQPQKQKTKKKEQIKSGNKSAAINTTVSEREQIKEHDLKIKSEPPPLTPAEPEREPASAPEPASVHKDVSLAKSIRVNIASIDKITALLEEMQINKNMLSDQHIKLTKIMTKTKSFSDVLKKITVLAKNINPNLRQDDSLKRLDLISNDALFELNNDIEQLYKNMNLQLNDFNITLDFLDDEIKTIRLIPLSALTGTLKRYTRELAHQLNKKVELKIVGDEIKIDKMILEKLKDPFIHLLRNSIDHGIEDEGLRRIKGKPEVGLIEIEIKEKNGQVYINMTDDGSGISIKQIAAVALHKNLITQAELDAMDEKSIYSLIFKNGFSTKDIITDTSGRGVGLDILKTNIENMNGQIEIDTEVNKFTTFKLRIPVSLSSERGLLVNTGGQLFAIPTNAIASVLTIRAHDIYSAAGRKAIDVNGQPISFCTLTDEFQLAKRSLSANQNLSIVVLTKNKQSLALLVDDIIGEREIVIKSLQAPLKKVSCISGGTLYGNNQVILVLEPTELISKFLHSDKTQQFVLDLKTEQAIIKPHILVVDDSITTRTLEKNILESKNYQVTVAVNGQEAWDILQKQTFSLVITDISMPILDGFSLTEKIKESDDFREIPVIIVTSLGSEEEKKRGVSVGANAYIIKHEFESGVLLDIVEQLI